MIAPAVGIGFAARVATVCSALVTTARAYRGTIQIYSSSLGMWTLIGTAAVGGVMHAPKLPVECEAESFNCSNQSTEFSIIGMVDVNMEDEDLDLDDDPRTCLELLSRTANVNSA